MKMQVKNKFFRIPLLLVLSALIAVSCHKEYSIENYNNKIAAGNWQFSEGATAFAGNMDTTYIIDANGTNELHLVGVSNDGSQAFHMVLYSADSFKVGTYKASAYQSSFEYGSVLPRLYAAGQLNGEFIVKITSINASLITGIFSGKAVKNGQDTVDITDGMFKSVFGSSNAQTGSSGVLGDSSGHCKPVTVAGVYKQGSTLSPANTVTVEVSVAVAGSYHIFTDATNGVSFSAMGTFDHVGSQAVVLSGTGIPDDAGEKEFFVHFGNSQCAFKINFEAGTAVINDYYPLKEPTDWLYNNGFDEIFARVTNTPFSWNGNSYSVIGIFSNPNDFTPSDTLAMIRKGGGLYYSYNDYADLVQSSQPIVVENIFLKDNVPQGSSWDGPEFSATVNGGTVKYHLKYTITAKAVQVAIGSFNFPDVIKVTEQYYSGNTYLGLQQEKWYAKNVGLIYSKGDLTSFWSIVDYHVFF